MNTHVAISAREPVKSGVKYIYVFLKNYKLSMNFLKPRLSYCTSAVFKKSPAYSILFDSDNPMSQRM